MEVTFFHSGAREFGPPAAIDPDREPHRFERGEHAWTVQTCVRLARAGLPVSLADRAPSHGIVVFHAKERRELLRSLPARADVLLVGIRADNGECRAADAEVVQNGRFADGRRRVFIPFWPQPGLVPRDPGRGATIRRAAFKGFTRNLASELRSPAWSGFLDSLGIDWVLDGMDFHDHLNGRDGLRWADYRDIDLVVAVRETDLRLHTEKPAAKLYNAWAAGVPAVLGCEHAYRELRHSELDYLEVADLAGAQAAVARLLGDPALYRRMVEHGRRRAGEFAPERILERWRTLLFSELPAFAATPRGRLLRRLPVRVKAVARAVTRRLAVRPRR
ncbi:MAG: hypothetical protein HY825_12315 [Acidobacteria bacterium]|nr:hypothetical protein [Acidobacteriota bacterium]